MCGTLFLLTLIIRNVSRLAKLQFSIISEGSCDSEDWSNGYNYDNISQYYSFFDQIKAQSLLGHAYLFKNLPTTSFSTVIYIYIYLPLDIVALKWFK